MDITTIISAVTTLIVAVLTTFVIPWIKAKVNAEKLQTLAAYVDIAVGAAEQIAKAQGWDGEKKKSWALNYLNGLGLVYDYDTVNALIENAVIQLHTEINA